MNTTAKSLLWLLLLLGPVNASFAQVNVIYSRDIGENGGPLCGLYALLGATESLDISVDPDKLIDARFVSSEQGSSALDLCSAAKTIGLDARVLKGLSVESLKRSRSPMILHLNRSRYQTTNRHWVLFLGDENGAARIYDAPNPMSLRNYADLLAEWDCVAVQISNGESPSPHYFSFLSHKLPILFVLLVLILVLKCLAAQYFVTNPPRFGAAVVLLGVAGLANIGHMLAPTGVHRCPSAAALVSKYHFALSLPEITVADAVELTAGNNGKQSVIFVDARQAIAFEMGHIPMAVSLPVNSSPEVFADAVKELMSADKVVVYCQSHGCNWDELIARHLVFAGVSNVVLFTGGWREWTEHHDEK